MVTVAVGLRVPNTALRRARVKLGMSQSDLAAALRAAGEKLGEPNSANKRLVQKWESGEHAACRAGHARALEAVTGLPFWELGLAGDGDRYTRAAGVPVERGDSVVEAVERAASVVEAAEDGQGDRLQGALAKARRARGRGVDVVSGLDAQLSAGGQAAALGGWLALDRGDVAAALRCFDAALAAARALSASVFTSTDAGCDAS